MDEDWDQDSDKEHKFVQSDTYPTMQEPSGKIFGSRGRGFQKFESNKNDYFVGKHTSTNTCQWKNESEDNWEGDRRQNFHNDRRDGFKRNEQNELQRQKPKSIYVPDAPTEDEDELFGSCISSGINFDKYDDIEVKVTGENPPRKINSFEEARLRPHILKLIKKCNYNKPTPIQKYSIPIVLSQRDMMACAQTGSGKTAAFLIPIINSLLEEKYSATSYGKCTPLAVVLSPTRELSIQIFNEARKFSRDTYLKIAIAYGGTSVNHQMENIKNGCHIIVATPGRFNDFVRRQLIEFSMTKFLVLDEADRMLDMGFSPDIRKVMEHPTMPPTGERQTLMFSATFPEEVQYLASTFLDNYLFVTVGIVGGACADVEQRFFSVDKFDKRKKLVELLAEEPNRKCLVFVERRRITDFIATFLCEKNFRATSIHGDRGQREREEALRDFKNGKMNILVATSVAARGLDIKNVSHVVNFDLPTSIDEYVHRIGRTGRVGNKGLATSFFDVNRDAVLASSLVNILRQANQEVPDFLLTAGLGNPTSNISSDFGGKDCRQGFGSKVETFENEVW